MSDEKKDVTLSDVSAAVSTLKDELERGHAEAKRYGDELDETKGKLNELNDVICDYAQMKQRLEAMETTLQRPEFKLTEGADKDELKEYRDKYWKAMRAPKGTTPIEVASKVGLWDTVPTEVKVLSAGVDTTSGYLLAPPEFVQQIIKPIDEYSPIRSVAAVRSTSRQSVQVPKRTGTHSASWVAEAGTRSETTGQTFGLIEVGTHELYAEVHVTWQDLEDSAFDLEAYLGEEFGTQFAVAEGTAFVSGNGVGRPYGFVTQLTNESKYTALGHASTIDSFDGLIELQHATKVGYSYNWGMRRATIGVLRTIKGGDGHYLWEPSQQAADPMNFLGERIVEMKDMPAIASNAYSVVHGDFKRGYQIVDRLGIQIIRDPYTSKSTGTVEFTARMRVGGQPILTECMRLGKISTS